MPNQRYRTHPGHSYPQGATVTPEGVNFSVFSRDATAVRLVLYEKPGQSRPSQILELDPVENRTFFFWHILIEGAGPGLEYTWRVDSIRDDAQGDCFHPERELLDPWARRINDTHWDRHAAVLGSGSAIRAMVTVDDYDWEGDLPVNHPLGESVIYELHVAGFTRHDSSDVQNPGTFLGLREKIPYLKELGITDIELMPVMAFDAQDIPSATTELGLSNYWGYSPCAFFAVHPAYAAAADPRDEFRDLVKALHRNGIGVILDVVLNHTAEGGTGGPVISFKGLANDIYYHLDAQDPRKYRDYTGCGNTLNCNHPIVTQLLVQCVEYWVREMHVDGFRFDLASALSRDEDGEIMHHAPVLWAMEFSETLSRTKLIAEAWDATGASQLGNFPGFRWSEWNGRFRDAARRFWRGDPGLTGELASRIGGSSDLFSAAGGLPVSSVNFVTCHDGFTLHDLVSYNQKHNEQNGESNRDGSDENWSWNCGHEGPTAVVSINRLRRRQARNHMAILLLSQGVPMLLAGDEVLRTQRGNNNAYCQDNELSWFDWSLVEKNADMLRFTREMLALRKRHPALRRDRFLSGKTSAGMPDIAWHGKTLEAPDWNDADSRCLAFTLAPRVTGEEPLHVILNAAPRLTRRPLPRLTGLVWHRAVDTTLESPEDILPPTEQPLVDGFQYRVPARSVVVLEARAG
jgi:glycogen operon protein